MHALKEQIKKDSQKMLLLYLGIVAIFASSFYRDPLAGNIVKASKLYFFFVVPPYLLYATGKPENFDRELIFYIGLYTGAALIASYYLGIAGVNVSYHHILLPLLAIAYAIGRAAGRGVRKQ